MKLYTKPGACSTADHIALQWTGKPFEIEVVDGKRIKQPDFLKLNPAGSVPVLVDGDFVLTQNAAILGYIADVYPDANLGGDGSAKQRAQAAKWLAFCNSDLHPAFLPIFAPGLFIRGAEHYDAIKNAARQRVRGLLERADQALADKEWLAGFRSFADPYLYITLRWADAVGVDVSGLEHLAAFKQRMQADPGVQAVLKSEGLT